MKLKLILTAAAALAAIAGAAHADEDFQPKTKGTVILDVRISDALPTANSAIDTRAGGATGLKVGVTDSVMPTLGLSYFATDNIAVEAIAGVTYHAIKAQGPGVNVTVHDTWLLPPTVTVQYHVHPREKLSAYFGVGGGYMDFISGGDRNGYTVHLGDGFAPVIQGGLDLALVGRWSANLDVKKVFFRPNADINAGALNSKVTLDPLIVSVGAGYRF
jgi:outer membrane protein